MTNQIQPFNPNLPARPAVFRQPVNAQAITPMEILSILRRHVLMIISFSILGLIVGGGSWAVLRYYAPKYTATAFIEVVPPGTDDPLGYGSIQPNQQYYLQFRTSKAAFIKQQNTLSLLLRRPDVRETQWYKNMGTNDAAILLKAIKNLNKNLRVSTPRDVTYIQVSMTCGTKKEAAKIVNGMVDLFMSEQRTLATADTRAQLAERRTQQQRIQTELRRADETLETIRSGSEFVNLENIVFRDYLSYKLGELEIQHSSLQNQISRLESNLATLKLRAQTEFDDVLRGEMERDPIAIDYRRQIALLEPERAQQLARFGENHRRVVETGDQIKKLKENLVKRQDEIADIIRKANVVNAEDLLVAYTKQLETLQQQRLETLRQHQDMDKVRARYHSTMATRDEQQKLLAEVTMNVEKLQMTLDDPELSKVKSLGPAPEPLRVSSPRWEFYFPGGLVLGIMAGVALAFIAEMLNDLLRTPSDVMRHLGTPLLGTICHVDEDPDAEGVELCHVVRQAPYSVMSECYRQLRTNLKLSGTGGARKVLFITSVSAGDGKTCTGVNLASTLVAEDKKVLFIDANFRRPSTATLFPPAGVNGAVSEHPDYGLSNYLMGQCSTQDIIRPGGIEGLDIIDSGPLPANPAEILANKNMRQLLETFKQSYDYIIIDGPPLLVSDAKTLAAQADGTLLVFNASSTRRGTAQRALRELRDINAETIGIVLMGVKSLKGGYFNEMYSSYRDYQKIQIVQPV